MKSFLIAVLIFSCLQGMSFAADDPQPDYATHIAPIFRKYCVGCHNAKDHEGKLNLATFAGVMKGGEGGKVIAPKDLGKSRLIGMVERKTEPFMPPVGNKGPNKKEIALLKAWVKLGAPGPKGISPNDPLIVPKIKPTGNIRRAVNSLAVSPNGKLLAVARHGRVELLDAKTQKPLKTLTGLTGDVTDIVFSVDGRLFATASGEPGLYGLAVVFDTKTWKPLHRFKGHYDSLYSIAISPDGKLLATGSYDQKIKLWDIRSGKELRQLDGHNGPVHDLSFHPTGKLLASASGDRTVKLWDVATGKRLDTLGQPEKDQYAVSFGPDGKQVVAGGADNRIRVWAVTKMGKEGTNPLLYARFAHEATILRLAFSADGKRLFSTSEDRTVKQWETKEFTQLKTWKNQSDWVTGLAVAPNGRALYLGRQDGSLATLPLAAGPVTVAHADPVRLTPIPKSPSGALAAPRAFPDVEPNDTPKTAQRVSLPVSINGVLNPAKKGARDVDLYRFRARKGEAWILETKAARMKSPADTKIEVLHTDGRPVLRYQLQAVRDSYITFRPIDSSQTQVRVKNWEEMDLNQYLYMGGEIGRLFRMPQGPDSGFLFYTNRGKRRCYFDTSGTVHAKEDPVYIVEAYPPAAQLVDNGLPVFPLYFENDDDAERELGTDSRLTFTAPADGEYLVRVSDTRGFGGPNYKYTLTIQPPRPGFNVTLSGARATVPAGSGQRLTVNVDRIDGFNGEIRVEFSGLPPGFSVTSPIIIEADHLTSRGVINVDASVRPTVRPKAKGKKGKKPAAKKSKTKTTSRAGKIDWSKVKVTATANIHGRKVVKNVGGFGPIQVASKPKVIVTLEVDPDMKPTVNGQPSDTLVIAPGSTITAMLHIERNGYQGELKFDVDHLPHGMIVDNIGLNGILIRANENQRRIYLTAADWVPETTRLINAVALAQGNQASRPIRLIVRRPQPRK